MSTDNTPASTPAPTPAPTPGPTPAPTPAPPNGQDIEAIVNARVEEALRPIKDKLDAAYAARDTALAEVKKFEKEKRELELASLREQGKHKEAAELEIRERDATIAELRRTTIELTRDNAVRSALANYSFRSTNATDMAFREIVGNLVQDSNGAWVSKTNVSIAEYVKTFSEHPDNAFLIKPKANSGGGAPPNNPPVPPTQETSLFKMSQAEVLAKIRNGTLKRK